MRAIRLICVPGWTLRLVGEETRVRALLLRRFEARLHKLQNKRNLALLPRTVGALIIMIIVLSTHACDHRNSSHITQHPQFVRGSDKSEMLFRYMSEKPGYDWAEAG